MLEVTCSGTPWEIGYKHGKEAEHLVKGSVEFYTAYFQQKSKMDWHTAVQAAERFIPFLEHHTPDLLEEMKGLADGANISLGSVLALNARTEISMGMMDDGCTSLAWTTDKFSLAGQNWDWEDAQKARLIVLNIKRDSKPSISQVTEAGIIGKIGLNSAGVGVCLNAIRARGVNFSALPVHLALRTVLDSTTREAAVAKLRSLSVASSGHILVADGTGATSLESSHVDLVKLEMKKGQIAHSNHYLAKHAAEVQDAGLGTDSGARINRIRELLKLSVEEAEKIEAEGRPDEYAFSLAQRMLEDEDGFPTSINRKSSAKNPSSTLFSILMDLREKVSYVRLGRPTEPDEMLELSP